MNKLLTVLAALVLVGAACVDPPSPPEGPAPLSFQMRNTGATSMSSIIHGDGYLLFLQRESDEDADLNGDGDTDDLVPAVWDDLTGAVTSTAMAVPGGPSERSDGMRAVDGQFVALGVDETTNGDTDLNGDGDTDDDVLVIWDRTTGQTANLGLALAFQDKMWTGGGALMALVGETDQGTDLNGDGDTFDDVHHSWTPAGGVVNLGEDSFFVNATPGSDGRFLVSIRPSPEGTYAIHDAHAGVTTPLPYAPIGGEHLQWASGDTFAFLAREFDLGGGAAVDLNGDGDESDLVVHVLAADGTVTNLAVAVGPTRDLYGLGDGGFLFAVSEAQQGGGDLNGDGDTADHVVHVWTESAGLQNLGVPFPLRGGASRDAIAGGGLAAFLVHESEHGGSDLNGDGDTDDRVAHTWSTSTGLVNTGTSGLAPTAGPGGAAFSSQESNDGVDHNGDGDTSDEVVFAWTPEHGLGLLGSALYGPGGVPGSGAALASGGSFVAASVRENLSGVDLNGDGDTGDSLSIAVDRSTGDSLLVSGTFAWFWTAPAFNLTRWAQGNRALYLVPENWTGQDLNGDGDTLDTVLHVADANR